MNASPLRHHIALATYGNDIGTRGPMRESHKIPRKSVALFWCAFACGAYALLAQLAAVL